MIDTTGNESRLGSNETVIQLCQEARVDLEKALHMDPRELGEEVDLAEVRVVRIRDYLIDRIRYENILAGISRWHPVLNGVNMALSFIVGVEYPVVGIHRNLLEKAIGILTMTQKIAERIQKNQG